MAQFTILSARTYDPRLRVRVQQTGRLGFGDEVAKNLELFNKTWIKFAQDTEGSTTLLYMVVLRQDDPDAFEVKKAGKYYYLSTARMFDALEIDYRTQTVLYDLVRLEKYDEELKGMVFRMDFRVTNASKQEEEDQQLG